MEVRLKRALKWIAEHGDMQQAPFPDNEIADIFRDLVGLIRHHKKKWEPTEDGWRELAK